MSGPKELSYEVYYLQSGQWRIHARFAANKRDEAEEEAKRLDTSGFEASCVVRRRDPETATSNETVVYHTPTLKPGHRSAALRQALAKRGWLAKR